MVQNLRESAIFGNKDEIELQLAPNEKLVFKCDTSKRNRFGSWQSRTLLLTNMRVINAKGTQFKSTVQL